MIVPGAAAGEPVAALPAPGPAPEAPPGNATKAAAPVPKMRQKPPRRQKSKPMKRQKSAFEYYQNKVEAVKAKDDDLCSSADSDYGNG